MSHPGGTVLVVDDVADARELVSTILTLGGYDVVVAATGNEALQRIEDAPDLVVLDVHLPDIDGFEVCRRIKSDPRSATTPVVQMSAIFSRTEHQVRGLTGGADAYLTKPFDPELLVATVNALMRLRTIERELSRSNRALRLQQELTQTLVEGTPTDITPRVLGTIGHSLGADVAELWRMDGGDEGLVRDAVWYSQAVGNAALLDRVTQGLRLPRGQGIAGRAWEHASVEWVDTVEERLIPARADAVRRLGLRSALVIPIVTRTGVAGAVVLLYRGNPRPSEDLLRLASDAGARVGLFIERRRNAEALQRAEEQLRQSQKMDAVGRLAGGIAHDFNNLLTVIGGHAQLLLEELPATSTARREAEIIAVAADRASTLTAGLLAFSRKQVVHTRVVALDELIRSMSALLRRMLGENITVCVHAASDVGHVRADPGQIEQVVMNLAVNARDAMPHGGQLTLALESADLTAAPGESLPPGPYVVLTVSDTGVGMTAETRARAFEPFYTTKAAGKGTGLGLATVYGIVTQSRGDIRIESEPGQGSTFRIFLPRVDAPAEPAPVMDAMSLAVGTETVLVVEDEESVRGLAVTALRKLGYTVLEAADARCAIELFDAHGGLVDLLVTDIVMPGMGGPALAERLRAAQPGVRVLYVSGYADEPPQMSAFLPKPYTGASLAQRVRDVLDG